MTIGKWLRQTTSLLKDVSPTPRLDAEVLLSHELKRDRAWIIAHPEYELLEKQELRLRKLLTRRQAHEPIAYIIGTAEFYGRTFFVTPDTLVPRPETETMLELFYRYVSNLKPQTSNFTIIDIGTGSGAIAVTAKLLFPDGTVYATDLSDACIEIAKKNALLHEADITLQQGNLLEPISELRTPNSELIILANLPYVPNTHTINEAAMQEPRVAIFGGPDGLDLYRELFVQSLSLAAQPSSLVMLTESLPFQHDELRKIASSFGYSQIQEEDFIQAFTRR